MKIFPTLYKKNSNGSIQFWGITVEKHKGEWNVVTRYGQKDTLSPQITWDIIKEGKNYGKKNATTAETQSYLEAEYKFKKQLKKGYVEKISEAESGKVNKIIAGGILPMLAHDFSKQGHKIKYPCYTQPKLDGHRCIAIIKDNKCTLWTRTRKLITSVPHINDELKNYIIQSKKGGSIILDGELYNHEYKNDFEYISHIIRQEEPDINHKHVQYHVYDLISEEIFNERYQLLKIYIDEAKFKYIKRVSTTLINNEYEMKKLYNHYLDEGYEGSILRNSNSLYVNKRSYDLQKVKEFDDAEFLVIGIKEGKGKLAGHVGSFICQIGNQTFDVKLKGELKELKKYFKDETLWKNKQMTVQFQGKTAYGMPRFPVGLRFREDI